MAVRSYDPCTDFGCVYCDIDLGDMTLGHGHDTSLGHWQQLCEILSRSGKKIYPRHKVDRRTDKHTNR